jgi:GDP-D-mannose dehydratase
MKKALIIGAAGFVGQYLIENIKANYDWSVAVTKMEHEDINNKDIEVYNLDILDKNAVIKLLAQVKPDYILHLAAQSSVALSWKNPGLTVDVNIKGSINVLDAIREVAFSPRVLLIGSGEEYGYVLPDEIPIAETNKVRPGNIYAVTKACQNMIGNIYARAYQMDIMSVRAFNHIGPRQSPQFVVADFCKQVAEIEAGQREPVIRVGNLEAERDFTDARDVVKAYTILLEKGISGETYNVGSGKAIKIRSILDMILRQAKVDIKVVVDKDRLRPSDVPTISVDVTKIKEYGWEIQNNIVDTIEDTLNYWRKA